jgi:lysophospholipase L1-like esterase
MAVAKVRAARSEMASKEFPAVRLFRAATKAAQEPLSELSGSWTIPDRNTVGDFPALAYLFAKEIQSRTQVPIGIIELTDPTPVSIQRGGSIMNGYSPYVIEALRGKVNVVRLVAFGMIGGNDVRAAAFCEKLKDGDYALIHYNDGLHSLPPRITDEQFGIGLTAMLKHLKTVAPRVIWATTTPAPDRNNTLGPESQNATVIARNEMSKAIAAEFGVPVVDLYGLVIDQREKLQGFANLHFTPEGSKRMGERIAARILEELNASTPPRMEGTLP